MSTAFDLFERERAAQGMEKMDGFSLGNLVQLQPDERAKAKAGLLQCIGQRDPRAPIALAVMEPTEETVQLLRAAVLLPWVHATPPDDFALEVAAAISVLSPCSEALDLLESALTGVATQWQQGIATDGFRRASVGSDASARLAGLIRATAGPGIKLDCADTLMQRHGWRLEDLARKAETLQLMRALIGNDAAARDAALLTVLQAPVQDWLASLQQSQHP